MTRTMADQMIRNILQKSPNKCNALALFSRMLRLRYLMLDGFRSLTYTVQPFWAAGTAKGPIPPMMSQITCWPPEIRDGQMVVQLLCPLLHI